MRFLLWRPMPNEMSWTISFMMRSIDGRISAPLASVRIAKVSASDVEADTGDRDQIFISDPPPPPPPHAADWLCVAPVTIGAKHAATSAYGHTTVDLGDGRFVVSSKNTDTHDYYLVGMVSKGDASEKLAPLSEGFMFYRCCARKRAGKGR